jgi:hypothetical protein
MIDPHKPVEFIDPEMAATYEVTINYHDDQWLFGTIEEPVQHFRDQAIWSRHSGDCVWRGVMQATSVNKIQNVVPTNEQWVHVLNDGSEDFVRGKIFPTHNEAVLNQPPDTVGIAKLEIHPTNTP